MGVPRIEGDPIETYRTCDFVALYSHTLVRGPEQF